jgi:hypothetical protein
VVSCGVQEKIKEYHLSLSSKGVVKGDERINSTYNLDRLQSDDGLTTCHAYSISFSKVILVKRGRLRGVSEMPLLPRGWSVSGVCVNEKYC